MKRNDKRIDKFKGKFCNAIFDYVNYLNEYIEQIILLDSENEYNKGYIEGLRFCISNIKQIVKFIGKEL